MRAPSDLLAAIPYLVGYHPDDSVVVLGLTGKLLTFSARVDAPEVSGIPIGVTVDHVIGVVGRQQCSALFLVGFGSADLVDPLLHELDQALDAAGLRVQDVLRADAGRYWSYTCVNPRCCPLEGTPYDPLGSEVAAEWTLVGRVALRDRAEYEAQLAPPPGTDHEAMRRAAAQAHEDLIDLLASAADEERAATALLLAGREAFTAALERSKLTGLTDEDVAWLSVLLLDTTLRDVAWFRIARAGEAIDDHRALWMDVLRRCEPDLVTAPATLFGFAAWRRGDGGLARLAFERALAQDPDCRLAQQLMHALNNGLPPAALDDLATDLTDTAVRRPRAARRSRRSLLRREGSRPA